MFTSKNIWRKLTFIFFSFFLLVSCSTKSSPTSASNQEYNLIVEIFTKNYQRGVIPHIKFDMLALDCMSLSITDDDDGHEIGKEIVTSPEQWCGEKALNLPIETDENGYAQAFFNIEPDPNTIELIHDAYLQGPSTYQVPMMFSEIGSESRGGRLSVKANNIWIYTAYFDRPIQEN
jgi:hypothetical protein